MSLEKFQFKGTNYANLKTIIKRQQNQQQKDESIPEQQHPQSIPHAMPKGKKKKVKKQEQNEGIRIAKQRKVQYIFKNICNPNGTISIDSLGKALAKHKIDFKVAQLQQMMALGKPQELNEQQSLSFESSQIHESIKNMAITYEEFKKFYEQNF